MIFRCSHRLCSALAVVLATVSASTAGPDSVVTFNEIHYHPAVAGEPEWVELHNQMGVRVDLGLWTLRGGIQYEFPEGTVVEPGAFVVISSAETPAGALGPFAGRLDNAGETLRLVGRHGRLMDALSYKDSGRWPDAADGEGFSLAKRIPEAASSRPESWAASAEQGGTPGQANFPDLEVPQERPLIAAGGNWKALAEDPAAAPDEWNTIAFDDSAWPVLKSPFVTDGKAGLLLRKTFAYIGATAGVVLVFENRPSASVTLYLNGRETGSVEATEANSRVLLPGDALENGANVLAIEVRLPAGDSEAAFDGSLAAISGLRWPAEPTHVAGPVVINELQYHARPVFADPASGVVFQEDDHEWIELLNTSAEEIDLSGWTLSAGVRYEFPDEQKIAPGGYLVVTNGDFSGALSNRGDRIALRDGNGRVIDEVSYFDSGRWPNLADGGGSTLELIDPRSDNSVGEAWAASDETNRSSWQEYVYRASGAEPPGSDNPDTWHEFLIGFLDAGEALVDDISVLEDPDGSALELISNGSFDADDPGELPGNWRLLGTHKLSRVVADPAGQGNVLHLIATGEITHTYNNASTTLVGNRAIAANRDYEIRFRARWLAGSPQLNTRLYLNRAARTHILSISEASGTPGATNSRMAANAGPTFRGVSHSPAVPEAGRPVFVTAWVGDPDGVGMAKLRFRPDGGEWEEVPMAADKDGRCLGIIPGQADNEVIQFYIEGIDDAGGSATFPARGGDSRALIRVGDDRVAGRGARNNLRLIMLDAEADALHERIHVVSNFRWGGTAIYNNRDVYYDVGVRLRSAPYGRQGRPGWNIQFGDENPFRGAHSTAVVDGALNVPRGDGTGWITTTAGASINELLFNITALRAGGIAATYDDIIFFAAPRRSDNRFAQLKMMRFEDPYLDEIIPNGSDGNLYKQELIYYPTTTSTGRPDGLKNAYNMVKQVDIRNLGDDRNSYRFNYLLRNNRARDDFSRIIAMCQAFSSTSVLQSDRIEEFIDVDNWLRTLAFNALFGVADTYNNGLAHNLVFYSRPDDGRVMIFPWDLDHALYYAPDSSIFGRGTHRVKLLIDRSWNRRRFRGHLLDICSNAFRSDYLDPWVDHLHEVADQNYATRFKRWIAERRAFVLEQIESGSPQVEFRLDAGIPGETDEPLVTLGGEGWVDVYSIRLTRGDEAPVTVPAVFRDGLHWEVTVPLIPGANLLKLEALNYRGEIVGTDTAAITQSGGTSAPGAGSLLITELMYHPAAPTEAEQRSGFSEAGAFEFVELANASAHSIQLEGARFATGVDFEFPRLTMAPGQRVVVVSHATGFLTRYGGGAHIAGVFSGNLANGGETVRLVDALGSLIDEIDYDDELPWPPEADGEGFSLTRIEFAALPGAAAETWRPSALPGGSAGGSDAVPSTEYPSLLDYAFGDPRVGAFLDSGQPILRWRQRTAADDVVVVLEASSDLVTWSPIATPLLSAESSGDGFRTLSAMVPINRGSYFRCRALPRP